jgi:hypothetical protein
MPRHFSRWVPSALAISTDKARPESSWIRSEIGWVPGLQSERERGWEVAVGVEVPAAWRDVRMWSIGRGDNSDILKDAAYESYSE